MGEILMAVREELKPISNTIPTEQPMEAAHTESTPNPPSSEEQNGNSV